MLKKNSLSVKLQTKMKCIFCRNKTIIVQRSDPLLGHFPQNLYIFDILVILFFQSNSSFLYS